MGATCGKCGDCCKVIALAQPLGYYRAYLRYYRQWDRYRAGGGTAQPEQPSNPDTRRNAAFIGKHWHRVTRAEAARLLPGMGAAGAYYYTCDAWDATTRRCTAREERPPICSDFPWYGGTVGTLHSAFTRCTFWRDVPQEHWPTGVQLPQLIQIQRKREAA